MTQNIQLYQTVIDGVIVIMGRDDTAVPVIGRMAHGSNVMDVHIPGDNHDACRMLAGGTLHPVQPLDKAFHIGRMRRYIVVFKIVFSIGPGRFRRHGSYRTGTADIVPTKKFFRIFMGIMLVFIGKI